MQGKIFTKRMIRKLINAASMGIILIGMLTGPGWSRAAETYTIDPDHSSITFRIKHLGITFVYGVFSNAGGIYTFDDADLENASIWIKVRVADIDTGSEKRDQDLQSPDFFDEKKFPFIIFKSLSITAVDADQYLVTGELSMHGETRQVTVRAVKTGLHQDPAGEYRSGFEIRFSVKRSDYGMQYMTAVADKVALFVSVEGVRIERSMSSSSGLDNTFRLGCE